MIDELNRICLILIALGCVNFFGSMVLQFLKSTFGPYFWPFAALCTLGLTHVGKKCVIIGVGAYYLLMSQDKSFQLPRYDPGEVIAAKDQIMRQQSKTLILIRHGESIWNEVFNRGINWKLPFRLMYALCRETVLFVTSDSVLYDSPLSTVGITQAKQIRQSIVSAYDTNNKGASTTTDNETQASLRAQYLDILRNAKAGNSLIVSSPLRRCIETVSLGLFDRMNDSKERIVLHSALQEMTRNIDGVSLSYEYERPPLSLSMRGLEDEFDVDWEQWFDERIVADQKAGFKSPHRRGDDRMRSFVSWMFQQPQDTFIVSGHSLWNRFFFQAYLPRTLQHRGKVQKIANGGVIAVKLMEIKVQPGLTRYVIDADSIVPIVKDFERKKIKSKKRS